jgi:hypothetical protein
MGKVKSKLNTNECEDEAWDGTREIEMNIEEKQDGVVRQKMMPRRNQISVTLQTGRVWSAHN